MRVLKFNQMFREKFTNHRSPSLKLEDGARVAVMGGGPAGSLFTYFLLDLASRAGLELEVDIYEPRDFNATGPAGCNMCAGIISESLIQMLALEGVNLPQGVVQRAMDSYMLHNQAGRVLLQTPDLERRIGAVFRGAGPRGIRDSEVESFDGYLLRKAVSSGAHLIPNRVDLIERCDGRLMLKTGGESTAVYDFVAVATGVNTKALRLFKHIDGGYRPPRLAQTYVREYYLGRENIQRLFGQTIHFFLADIPGLDFAAIVPKGSYVTVCLLGDRLDEDKFNTFLNSPQVKECMPEDWQPVDFNCHCAPRINLAGAVHPYAERMVFLGDIGISRLYKDGIGAAYRAAKSAASAAIFAGIGESDLKRFYGRSSRSLERDNSAGKIIFTGVKIIKPWRSAAEGMLRMIETEQTKPSGPRRMSSITWDLFTGSAPYRDILIGMLNPSIWIRFTWHTANSFMRGRSEKAAG